MWLEELVDESLVNVRLAGRTKREILVEIVDLLWAQKRICDKAAVFDALWEREQNGSTGIGKGVAVPHARIASLAEPVLFLGIAPGGVDFASLDGQPVYLFFLLLSPQGDPGQGLKILAQIARLANDTNLRQQLLKAASGRQACQLINTTKGVFT